MDLNCKFLFVLFRERISLYISKLIRAFQCE